jgi:hypothetical protein
MIMGEHDQNINALLALAIIARKIQESLDLQEELGMLEQNPFSGEYVPVKSTHPLTDQQIADNNSDEIWDADMDVSDAAIALCKFRL